MILDEALADVVQQERHQQRPLPPEGPPFGAEPVVRTGQRRHPFDGEQAVLVHGVFVEAVELQQVAGMRELRDQDLEHPHVVKPAERRGHLRRMGKEFEKGFVGRAVHLTGQVGHAGPHGFPGATGDRHVVKH